jgi:pimeloyl-ACP methyl ester carboxylesterase
MNVESVLSDDGVRINYARGGSPEKPCVVLVMPFGLRLDLADAFFKFYESHYYVVTWEARLILDPPEQESQPKDFSVRNHVRDLRSVLRACDVSKAFLVGYCSGAGIALAAANRYPQLFSNLILVHGEYTLLEDELCTTQFATEIDSLLSMAARDEEQAKRIFEKVNSKRSRANNNVPEGIDAPFTQLPYLRRHAMNYVAYKSTDFKKLAQCISHRSLLLTGDRDVQANAESTRRIHGLMRNADIHVDPNADHYGILREDSRTLATIWNYIRAHGNG